MKELTDELSYDLAECHVDYLDDAKLYTDYDTMAQKLISRGYRRQSGWVSVNDKLPQNNEWCLLFHDNGQIMIGWYNSIHKTFIEGCVESPNEVTHWMPLPEPPKGGAE